MNYSIHHTAISVRNLSDSVEFYKLLGFEKVHEYHEDDGSMSIVHLKLGSYFLEIFHYQKNANLAKLQLDYANGPDRIGVKHVALSVDNIDAALVDLKNKGLADHSTKITVGRTKVSYFFIKDPDGMWVEIVNDQRYS